MPCDSLIHCEWFVDGGVGCCEKDIWMAKLAKCLWRDRLWVIYHIANHVHEEKTKKWEQLNPPKPLTNDGRQSPHVSRGREQVSRHAFFHRLRHRTVPNCAVVWQCVTVCDTMWHCSKAELSFFRGKLTTLVLPLLLTTSRQPVNKGWTGTFFQVLDMSELCEYISGNSKIKQAIDFLLMANSL